MLENGLSETVTWQTNKWSNYKVSSLCLYDNQVKQETIESVGELSQVCSQFVLKCLYMARLGRPDILWSVNKIARAVTNGLKHVTDDWQDWFHTFTTQSTTDNIVMWVARRSIVDGVLKINCGRVLCIFFEWNTCSCKFYVQEQTSVSHRSTQSEIDHFSGCWITQGWNICSRSLGRGNWRVTFNKRHSKMSKLAQGNLCGTGNHSINKTKTILLKASLSCALFGSDEAVMKMIM